MTTLGVTSLLSLLGHVSQRLALEFVQGPVEPLTRLSPVMLYSISLRYVAAWRALEKGRRDAHSSNIGRRDSGNIAAKVGDRPCLGGYGSRYCTFASDCSCREPRRAERWRAGSSLTQSTSISTRTTAEDRGGTYQQSQIALRRVLDLFRGSHGRKASLGDLRERNPFVSKLYRLLKLDSNASEDSDIAHANSSSPVISF